MNSKASPKPKGSARKYFHLSIEKDNEGRALLILIPIACDISRDRYYLSAAWHKAYSMDNATVYATSDMRKPMTDAAILALLEGWRVGKWRTTRLKAAKDRPTQSKLW